MSGARRPVLVVREVVKQALHLWRRAKALCCGYDCQRAFQRRPAAAPA